MEVNRNNNLDSSACEGECDMIKSQVYCDVCGEKIHDDDKTYDLILGCSVIIKNDDKDQNFKPPTYEYKIKYDIFGTLNGGVQVCAECMPSIVKQVNNAYRNIFKKKPLTL